MPAQGGFAKGVKGRSVDLRRGFPGVGAGHTASYSSRERVQGAAMTDFYQGVVGEYLRANRSTFINSEYVLQLDREAGEPTKGSFWYADYLALDTKAKTAFLCEVTYVKGVNALIRRLTAWSKNWQQIEACLYRDSCLSPLEWKTRVWIFVPERCIAAMLKRLPTLSTPPLVTPLEMTAPWLYSEWNRDGESEKPDVIPEAMRR
jgi:hypothetical protein